VRVFVCVCLCMCVYVDLTPDSSFFCFSGSWRWVDVMYVGVFECVCARVFVCVCVDVCVCVRACMCT